MPITTNLGGGVDVSADVAAIKAKTDNLPSDPADESLLEAAITTAESNIRGVDNDTLKTLSDQIDGIGGGSSLNPDITGPITGAVGTTDTASHFYADIAEWGPTLHYTRDSVTPPSVLDVLIGATLTFTSGANDTESQPIGSYDPSTREFFFDNPFSNTPSVADTFEINLSPIGAAVYHSVKVLTEIYTSLGNDTPSLHTKVDALGGGGPTTAFFQAPVVSAANAGAVTIATATDETILIKSVVVISNGATTADLTNITITAGSGGVLSLIDSVSGVKANLDATDKSVAWTGALILKTGQTVKMTLTGTGATAVDFDVYFEYIPTISGGTLA